MHTDDKAATPTDSSNSEKNNTKMCLNKIDTNLIINDNEKRVLHQSICNESNQSHMKRAKATTNTIPAHINSTMSTKCVKCQEEDFGLMIACSTEGCFNRYHASCMDKSQLQEMERFKCYLHA